MGDVQAYELAEQGNHDPETASGEAGTSEKESGGDGDSVTSFSDAFKRATGDEVVLPDSTPETPEEPKPEDPSPEEPEAKTESRSAKDFKSLKQERDTANAEVTSLKERLKELENGDVNAILEDVQKERDDLSERLKLAAIERHPEFQKKFSSRVDASIEQAKRTVGEEHAERVEKLLRMEDSEHRSQALEDLFTELPASKAAVMGAAIQSIGEVRAERDAALSNADETYRSIMAEQDAEQHEHLKQSNALFDEVAKEASNLEVYQVRDNDAKWNQEVQARLDRARTIFTGNNDASELIRASLWAAAAPFYRQTLGDSLEVNRRLREQVGGLSNAVPSLGGNGKADPGDEAAPKGFVDAFKSMTQ